MYCAAGAGLALVGFAQQTKPALSSGHPGAAVREEQTIVVDGLRETWRLQWRAAPKPYCEPGGVNWPACPCRGFAYGEAGDLFLARLRSGTEIDRLHLTPFFTEGSGDAIVRRWQPDYDKDLQDSERRDFPSLVSERATVQAIHFADYDHDGRASEFYLQTEALPCGKSDGIVIGLSRSNSRLHVFGAASHPGKPLHVRKLEWEALRDASVPVEVLDWACGDHGANTETTLRLRWTREGIEGVRREYTCPAGGKPRRRIHEEPL